MPRFEAQSRHAMIPLTTKHPTAKLNLFVLAVMVLISLGTSARSERLDPKKYFDGRISLNLDKARETATAKKLPIIVFMYNPDADDVPGMRDHGAGASWALGYFTEKPSTRKLMSDNFVTVLLTTKQADAKEIVGNELVTKPMVFTFAADGTMVDKREVYANPTEGFRIINEIIAKCSAPGIDTVRSAYPNPNEISPGQPPSDSEGTAITVNPIPSGMNRSGMLPVDDIINLLSDEVSPSSDGMVLGRPAIYGTCAMFDSVPEVLEKLQIPNDVVAKLEVVLPGWPEKSFYYRPYDIPKAKNDDFNRLVLVTDFTDRLVSVLFVDEAPQLIMETPKLLKNWHTFDFVESKRRLMTTYIIDHKIRSNLDDVLQIDSVAFIASKVTVGEIRLVDRAKWFLPKPLAALLLQHSLALKKESDR